MLVWLQMWVVSVWKWYKTIDSTRSSIIYRAFCIIKHIKKIIMRTVEDKVIKFHGLTDVPILSTLLYSKQSQLTRIIKTRLICSVHPCTSVCPWQNDCHCSREKRNMVLQTLRYILLQFTFMCFSLCTCDLFKKAVSPLAVISLNIKLLETHFDLRAM